MNERSCRWSAFVWDLHCRGDANRIETTSEHLLTFFGAKEHLKAISEKAKG